MRRWYGALAFVALGLVLTAIIVLGEGGGDLPPAPRRRPIEPVHDDRHPVSDAGTDAPLVVDAGRNPWVYNGDSWESVKSLSSAEGEWRTDGGGRVELLAREHHPDKRRSSGGLYPWYMYYWPGTEAERDTFRDKLQCGVYETLHKVPSGADTQAFRIGYCWGGAYKDDDASAERITLLRSRDGRRLIAQVGNEHQATLESFSPHKE